MSQHAAFLANFKEASAVWQLAELLSIRQGVMGSVPLIALIQAGVPPEGVSQALAHGDAPNLAAVADSIAAYVTQLAMGDAAVRLKQTLLPMRPPGDAMHIFMHSTPDWSELYAYVDCKNEQDTFEGDPAWLDSWSKTGETWRARLEKALAELRLRFLMQVTMPTFKMQANLEAEAILTSASPAMLDEALATVEPIPAYLTEAIEASVNEEADMSPNLERGYMEALHSRGAAIWRSLAKQSHAQGKEFAEQAAALPQNSREQMQLQLKAIEAFSMASKEPNEAADALVSSVALLVQMQNWSHVLAMAQFGLKALDQSENEPESFHGKRAACALALRTGFYPKLPQALKPHRTSVEQAIRDFELYSLTIMTGHGHAAIARAAMNSDGAYRDESFVAIKTGVELANKSKPGNLLVKA